MNISRFQPAFPATLSVFGKWGYQPPATASTTVDTVTLAFIFVNGVTFTNHVHPSRFIERPGFWAIRVTLLLHLENFVGQFVEKSSTSFHTCFEEMELTNSF